jgi:hypothetical protein
MAVAELSRKQKQLNRLNIIKHWVLDGADSIPADAETKSAKFIPLAMTQKYTVGFSYADSTNKAYFYAIVPSHKATIKATFQTDSARYSRNKLPLLKSLVAGDEAQQNYYVIIYSEDRVKDKTPSITFRVTPAGLAWSTYMYWEGTPLEVTVQKPNGELTVKVATATGNKLITIMPDGKTGG